MIEDVGAFLRENIQKVVIDIADCERAVGLRIVLDRRRFLAAEQSCRRRDRLFDVRCGRCRCGDFGLRLDVARNRGDGSRLRRFDQLVRSRVGCAGVFIGRFKRVHPGIDIRGRHDVVTGIDHDRFGGMRGLDVIERFEHRLVE